MKRLIVAVMLAAAAVATTGCATLMTMIGKGPTKPAASEFGLGPRTGTLYTATLEPSQPLRPRKLQTVQVRIVDANGTPVDGAAITIDGGMPQHGHGLPTRPRVTRNLGAGVYEIEGVRFNMGGWWEFKLAIATPAGIDRVTFNLAL
jgi:hypothetical protein